MRYAELKESLLNGLTVMSLKQFVKSEDDDLSLDSDSLDDEDLLGESLGGLHASLDELGKDIASEGEKEEFHQKRENGAMYQYHKDRRLALLKKYKALKNDLNESILSEKDGEFGLGSKYRNASHKEMQDYLDRTVFKRKDKLDKFKMPYIHPSNIKKNSDGSIPIIDENGDKYDLEALKKAITKRPNTLLKQNEKMKHSDHTADVFYNVGLPALVGLALDESTGEFVIVNTCPGAGKCKTFCYAMKGSYIMFPAVSMKQTQTLNFLLNDPEGFEAHLIKEIQKEIDRWDDFSDNEFKKGTVKVAIRFHDSGDFFSPEYMDMAWNVAKTFPDNLFYSYTKVASVSNSKERPKNFIMNFSAGALSTQSKLVNIKTTKHSQVVPKEMFFDLIDRSGIKINKDKQGRTQFKSPEALEEFKERMSQEYDIPMDSIKTYDEMMDEPKTDNPWMHVIVTPGTGDISAARADVIGTYLLFH